MMNCVEVCLELVLISKILSSVIQLNKWKDSTSYRPPLKDLYPAKKSSARKVRDEKGWQRR